MNITYCDITKKPIDNATTNYSWETKEYRYNTIQDKDLSVNGLQKLEDEVYKEMGQRKVFSFMEYKQILQEKLKKMTR